VIFLFTRTVSQISFFKIPLCYGSGLIVIEISTALSSSHDLRLPTQWLR